MNSISDALKKHFGFDEFLPGQREIVESLVAGQSALAVFPTGGGKSLCYQLPALLLEGVTLVVSPLIALMKDQIDALERRGIAAARLDSTLSADEYRDVLERLRSGQLKLLYVAPERFQNERFRGMLAQIPVALFAVDEAHCISEWGHNFRPDYLKLVDFARQSGAGRLLALTATATPQVLDDICAAFQIEPAAVVRNSSYRPNLTLLTSPVQAAKRDALLVGRLQERPRGPTIVYVTLQRTAEAVAAHLTAQGLAAAAYHAGMDDDQRNAVQDAFMRSSTGIVVATIAFGMGIDKSNIRYVYHYNLPKSLENYSQEIGRAGRDGLPATCEMFVCADDLNQLENFAYGDTPTPESIERLVSCILDEPPQFDVSLSELSNACDIRLLVTRTLLTYLELDGYLTGGTPFYSGYKFKPLHSSQAILTRFSGERRHFLEQLFRQAKKGRTWFEIDVERAAQVLHTDRDRVIRALDYLNDQGCLELQAVGTRNRYERKRSPEDRPSLVEELHGRCLDRQEQSIARIEEVLDLAREANCQVAALCRHFGEERSEPCGHCSRCLEPETEVRVPQRNVPAVDPALVAQVQGLGGEYPVLREPVNAARLLCGITSPALTRAKLSKHPLFGRLEGHPFASLRELLAARPTPPARGRRG
jgi:ATP-dependent DNA helicase RecQ